LGFPYEDKKGVPDPVNIGKLVQSFPDIEFNLAIQLPILSGRITHQDEVFQKGLESAKIIAKWNKQRPHLRIVDPVTPSALIEEQINTTCSNVQLMAKSLSDINGILSLENSSQLGIWKNLSFIINTVKKNSDNIRLCYDPCNVLVSDQLSGDELAKLTPLIKTPQGLTSIPWKKDDIGIYHIKQRKDKEILNIVTLGEVNWALQLKVLKSIGYFGPICLEMNPSESIFDNIRTSINYLNLLNLNSKL